MTRVLVALGLGSIAAAGCGGAQVDPRTTPESREVVHMEEMRITARRSPEGEYEFASYDAAMLFREATRFLREEQCDQAVRRYDRLVEEFPGSRYVSPALYNAGLCLQHAGQPEGAVERYDRLVARLPGSPDVKHATYQLAKLHVELERWEDAIAAADQLLARDDLGPDERVEAMARRAQALLGLERLEEAESQARTALGFARTRPEDQRVRDTYFVAAANYVLAETIRLRAAAIEVPVARVDEQRAELERRARHILDAQREYFNTIRHTEAHWAAAAGYHIGQMYEAFWGAIMTAPVPPPRKELPPQHMPVYEEEYRKELARLVKPLVRHSIRYWELTLMMIERTGVETEWKERIREDLARARARLLGESGEPASASEPSGAGDSPDPGEEGSTPRPGGPMGGAGAPDAGPVPPEPR